MGAMGGLQNPLKAAGDDQTYTETITLISMKASFGRLRWIVICLRACRRSKPVTEVDNTCTVVLRRA